MDVRKGGRSVSQDRRQWPRLLHDDQVIVKVLSSDPDEVKPGMTLYGRSSDISMHGLRVCGEVPLSIGTLLQLWIIASHRLGTIMLSGRVAWCAKAEGSDEHWVGIDLASGNSAADVADWIQTVRDVAVHARKQHNDAG